MRITELNVVRFGILENFNHKFEREGINFIIKNNAEGKSTLANFIRAMFYGLNYTRSQDVLKSDVMRFTPWNSTDKFGGTLSFEDGGRKYLIERFFHRTQRDETGKITDLSTGAELPLLDASGRQIGEKLFNLSAEEFMRCIFVPQGDIVLSEADFSARLSRLMEGDEQSGEDALRRLRTFCTGFVLERGKGGSIHRQREARAALIAKKNDAEERLCRSAENERLIEAAQNNAEQVRKQLISAEKEERAAAAAETNHKIKLEIAAAEVANAEEALAALPKVRYESIDADARHINTLHAEITALEKKIAPAAELNKEIKSVERAMRSQGRVFYNYYTAPTVWFVVLFIAASILTLLYIGYSYTWTIVAAALVFLATVFAGTVAVSRRRQKARHQTQLAAARADRDRLLELRGDIFLIAKKYGIVPKEATELPQALFELRARREERVLAARAAQLKFEQAVRTARDALAANGGEAVSAAEPLRRQLSALEREIVRLKAENAEILRFLPDLTLICEQIEQNEERERQMQTDYDAAQKAMEFLRAAKESLSCEYLPDLVDFLSEHVGKITGGRFASAALEKDLSIKLAGGGSLRAIESFSCGIREAAMFCLRLALSRRIFEGKIPLMILDDPLVNLDGEKYARVLEILQSLAEGGTQIIYFAKKG